MARYVPWYLILLFAYDTQTAMFRGGGGSMSGNHFIFNTLKAPLFALSHLVVGMAVAGHAFGADSGALTSGGASQLMVMQLTNPSGSGVQVVFDQMEITVNTTTLALFEARFDATAAGLTAISSHNLNTGSGATSACTVAAAGGAGVSLTGGTTLITHYLDMHDEYYPFPLVVTPGHTFATKYVFSASGNGGTFQFRWYEIPVTDSW